MKAAVVPAVNSNWEIKAVWLCLKYQIPLMLDTKAGAIVNMASMGGGVVGVPSFSSYEAAKRGVVGLTRAAAIEYASLGIRVNAVSPGMIATDILSNILYHLMTFNK